MGRTIPSFRIAAEMERARWSVSGTALSRGGCDDLLVTCSVPEEKVVKAEAEADSLNVPTLTVLAATTAVVAAEGITEIRMERFVLVEKGGDIGATMMLRIVVDLSGEVLVYHQSREPAGITRNPANTPLSFF